MNSRLSPVSPLILMLHIQVSITLDFTVTCYEMNICAVRGAEVTLSCSYSYHNNLKTAIWFSQKQSENWRTKEEPEDLTLDSDYAGRVNQLITHYRSQLTIRDLRETDSGEYKLMLVMIDGVRRLSSVAVNLTVTVPQVRITHEYTDQQVELICDTSCISGNYYYWFKNGRDLTAYASRNTFVSSDKNSDSYSCYIHPYRNNPSSSVCVSKSCWDVTYTSRRVCALERSTVDISSTYSHPTGLTVVNTFWYFLNSHYWEFRDLREEQQFAGRVEYVRNTLRIKDVKTSDSGEYQFRIITNTSDGKYSGTPGVILTVTDTQVTSSPHFVIEGEKVILSCLTKCTLDNKYTYIWYKNGTRVTDGFTLLNKLYLDSVSSEEIQEYSCAVGETHAETHTWSRNTAVILPVFLTLTLIGVLCYSMRRRNLSKNHKDAVEEAQYETVRNDAAPSELTQKDFGDQDIHYSSIHFGHLENKHTSTAATAVYPTNTTEKEDSHYAAVMFS